MIRRDHATSLGFRSPLREATVISLAPRPQTRRAALTLFGGIAY